MPTGPVIFTLSPGLTLHKKVEQVENERRDDRTWSTKEHLVKLKKQKLAVKDKLWKKN